MKHRGQGLDVNQLAGAVAGIGPTERAAPTLDSWSARFDQNTGEVNEVAGPKRSTAGRDRVVSRDEMKVGGMRCDFMGRNRRHTCPFVVEEARALTDGEVVEHGLIRHFPPTDREIDRRQRGLAIEAIGLPVQDAPIENKAGERDEMEFSLLEGEISRQKSGLFRVRRHQNARWISDGRVGPRIEEPTEDAESEEGEGFHRRQAFPCSRIDARRWGEGWENAHC